MKTMFARMAAGIACATMLGCNPEVRTCPRVEGVFHAQYQYVPGGGPTPPEGTCAVGTFMLTIDGGTGGVKTNTMQYNNQDIVTSVILNGCTVNVDVQVSQNGGSEITMTGNMDVMSADLLTGTVQGSKTEPNGTVCEGLFRATLSRPVAIAGAPAPVPPPVAAPPAVAPPPVAPPVQPVQPATMPAPVTPPVMPPPVMPTPVPAP